MEPEGTSRQQTNRRKPQRSRNRMEVVGEELQGASVFEGLGNNRGNGNEIVSLPKREFVKLIGAHKKFRDFL